MIYDTICNRLKAYPPSVRNMIIDGVTIDKVLKSRVCAVEKVIDHLQYIGALYPKRYWSELRKISYDIKKWGFEEWKRRYMNQDVKY